MFGALKVNLHMHEYLWVTLIAARHQQKERDLRLCEDLSKNKNLGGNKQREVEKYFLVFANT